MAGRRAATRGSAHTARCRESPAQPARWSWSFAEPRSATALRARLRPAIGPTAIGLAAYLAWKLHNYGEILPNTYYAKAADLASFGLGIEYLFGF